MSSDKLNTENVIWNLGDLLRSYRDKKGISRAKLAEFTGISSNTLMRYELAGQEGGKYPSAIKLTILCRFLEIDPRIAFDAIEDDFQIESYVEPSDDTWTFVSHFASQAESYDITHDQMRHWLDGLQRYIKNDHHRIDLLESKIDRKFNQILVLLTENGSKN